MSKTIINFFLDLVLAISFVVVLWSAVVVRFVFPAPAETPGWTLWGWTYDNWFWFEFVALATFGVMVLLHVMLHWSWVCGVVTHRLSQRLGRKIVLDDAQQTVVGVATMIVLMHLVGIIYLCALLTVREPAPSAAIIEPTASVSLQ